MTNSDNNPTRDLPETLSPVTGQGVPKSDYDFPHDPTPPKGGAPGTGIDITSETMPAEGILEVHDTDEELLDAERANSATARSDADDE